VDALEPRVSAAASKLREWREHPVTFVREVFNAEPDAWQVESLEAFPVHQRMAWKACKGPGKSTVLAWLIWLFLLTRLHPKVVATSITGDNLRDNLWTELAKWQKRSALLSSAFTWSKERIVCNAHPETWWASARTWPRDADATKQADTLAGIHGDFVLFVLDEAGGIPDSVAATAEAGLANADPARGTEAKLLIAGNPTHLSGPLYRACTRERRLWWVKEISSAPDDPQRTPRVSLQWAQEQIDKYGRENPWVLVNVFGQFPPGQSNALLGVEDVGLAMRRTVAEAAYEHSARVLGVDVARFGDDRSVIFPRQGMAAFRPKTFRNLDTMELADQVALSIQKWQPDAVFVDQTGVGAGVVDRLRQLGHRVLGVDNGGKATNPRMANKRAECWWNMAEWVRSGGCVPDDTELIPELTEPTYSFNPTGQLVLESKAHLKERGLPSPDKGDALALTFTAPVVPRPKLPPQLQGRPKRGNDYDPFADRSA
jgi:phage terminase large subunit